jgi:hypothetical protein
MIYGSSHTSKSEKEQITKSVIDGHIVPQKVLGTGNELRRHWMFTSSECVECVPVTGSVEDVSGLGEFWDFLSETVRNYGK